MSFQHLRLKVSDLRKIIEDILASARVCVLLDGLNEVPRDLFSVAAHEIQCTLDEYNWQKFVLTNRITNIDLLGSLDLKNWPVVHHKGLSPDSAKGWIANDHELGVNGQKALISAIDRGDKSSSLLLNPQRLALSCRYWRAHGRLPAMLADLFQEEIRIAAAPISQSSPVPLDIRFRLISLLAAEMTSRGILVADLSGSDSGLRISPEGLLDLANRMRDFQIWADGMTGSDMVQAFWHTLDCPFLIREGTRISFVHESYQDFFAGLWLAEVVPILSYEILSRIVSAPRWKQGVVLASGAIAGDALRTLFDALLRSDQGTVLAVTCVTQQPGQMDSELLYRILSRVEEMGRKSVDPEFRTRALDQLSDLDQVGALRQLILSAYKDESWMVRETAALHAGSICFADDPDELKDLFDDSVFWVRAAAVWAAGESRMVHLRDDLAKSASSDLSPVVRGWADFAMRRLDRPPSASSDIIWYEDYIRSGLFAECRGGIAAEFYRSGLQSSRDLTRSTSIEALTEMHYYPAFGEMRSMSSDASPYIRSWLMRAIGQAEVYGCSDVLCVGLRDEDAWVRFWAAHSARRLRSESCLDDLLRLLADEPEDSVFDQAILALSVIAKERDISTSLGKCLDEERSGRLRGLREAVEARLRAEEPFTLIHLAKLPQETLDTARTDIEAFITEHDAEIRDLAVVFSQYQRPDGVIMTDLHLKRWLRQFGGSARASYALRLLHHVDFYHRRRISDVFEAFIGTCAPGKGDPENTSIALLGNPTDSSSIVNYLVRDVLISRSLRSGDLKSILATSKSMNHIIFIDDNVGSGKQSVQIFHEWLSTGRRILEEKHVVSLGKEELQRLRNAEISIFACVGSRQGCNFVRGELEAMGLQVRTVTAFTLLDQNVGCFDPTSGVFPDSEQRSEAERMCREIGECLLSDKNWPSLKRHDHALGYGNAQKLVVFFYNVPTTTLPIFWKGGMYSGIPWFPLFPRREKVDIAVL
jgi:HEAT repeat protein